MGFGLLYALLRWALGRVATAVADSSERPLVGAIGLVIVALYVGRIYAPWLEAVPFAKPVSATYGRQVRVAVRALKGSNAVAASPPMNASLSRVKGADVFLVFLESYGAVTFDWPAFAERLSAARAQLDAAIHETGRNVVSGFVESPTFGGSSWLAHISLLSGVEVRDPDTNALLMAQKRDTLVTTFKRAGYRTVALMPGLWQSWPEGAFYGFDEIYGGARLGIRGRSLDGSTSPISSRWRSSTPKRQTSRTATRVRPSSCSSRRSAHTRRSVPRRRINRIGSAC